MTKIYEALENASRERQALEPERSAPAFAATGLPKSIEDKLLSLGHRIESLVEREQGAVVQFMGAQSGGDSSTLAYETALLAASRRSRNTLLLAADKARYLHRVPTGSPGTWEAAIGLEKPVEDAIHLVDEPNLSISRLGAGDLTLPALLATPEFADALSRLRQRFGLIVIDAPAFTDSSNGALLSAFADGLVLVVEAGRTRWQAIRAELDRIEAQGTRVLGVILARQRHYIPNFIYRRL